MAEVLVVLRIEGDWVDQGFRVMAEIGLEGDRPHTEIRGSLPPNPSLLDALTQWRRDYRDLKFASRIKPLDIQYKGSIHFIDDCKQRAQILGDRLQQWLLDESIRLVDQRLRECLNSTDQIRILIRSADQRLWQLPWHLWSLLDRYPQAEVVFSSPTFNQSAPLSPDPESNVSAPQIHSTVKILAILGHDEGIDVERDRHQLSTLPNADVTLLVKPQREELSDQLWNQPWDILFFAGHSQTQPAADHGRNTDTPMRSGSHLLGQGVIEINPTDSLSLSELRYGLKRAIANGLQIAIFNSCDGLGLLPEMEQLNLPHAIVMKEPIPDVVAHRFLTHFLPAFARGLPLHIAEREGREKLQALEKNFPCASWLPLLYQNTAARPVTWRSLWDPGPIPPELHQIRKTRLFSSGIAVGCITVGTILMRWLGVLEPAELWAYDHFTRQQPGEIQDERLLIITIDNADVVYQRQQGMDLSGSLSPQAIEALFQKLQPFNPVNIGLDIYEAPIPVPISASAGQFEPPSANAELSDAKEAVAGLSMPVFGICKVPSPQDGDPDGIAPPSAIATNFIGFTDFVTDQDSILRRQLLALRNANPTSNCTTRNAFNLMLALHYLNTVHGFSYSPDTFTANNEFQFSGDTVPNHPPNMGTKPVIWRRLTPNAGGYRNLDVHGYQLLLNFRTVRSLQDIATTISLQDLLSDKVTPYDIQQLQNRIVLVGSTDLATSDVWTTSHSRDERGAMKWTPGVIMQAQMVSQLLSSVLDQRPLIWWWTEEIEVLWILAWSGVGGVVVWYTRRSLPLVIFATLGTIGIVGISYFIFLHGGWIPVVPGAIAFLTTLGSARWLHTIRTSNA